MTVLFLASCTATSGAGILPSLDSPQDQEKLIADHGSESVRIFSKICSGSNGDAKSQMETAIELGFEPANKRQLATMKLEGIRKNILDFPGGGARFRETQTLYIMHGLKDDNQDNSKSDSKNRENSHSGPLVLAIEEKFARDKLLFSSCRVFISEKENFLKTCAALGKAIGKAPDSNTKYANSKGHFLKWNLQMGKHTAVAGCESANDYPAPGFSGTVLTLTTDLGFPKARKTSAPNVGSQANRQQAGGDVR